MNIVLSKIISCWKHPHFFRLKEPLTNFIEAFCPNPSLCHGNFIFILCLPQQKFAVKSYEKLQVERTFK